MQDVAVNFLPGINSCLSYLDKPIFSPSKYLIQGGSRNFPRSYAEKGATRQFGCRSHRYLGENRINYIALWMEAKLEAIPEGEIREAEALSLQAINDRRERLVALIRLQYRPAFMLSTSIIMIFISIYLFIRNYNELYVIVTVCLALIYSLYAANMRSAREQAERDLQTLEFEADLLRYRVSTRETRAEKVLRINDLQLSRYYSLNLSQNNWAFSLGIFCILIGVCVVSVTMYLIIFIVKDRDTQIISAITGIVGSMLTSYVAAIYLKMHAEASTHLGLFHQRLVETHQLLLGSLIACRIEEDSKRWDTLSQLALNIARQHAESPISSRE
jgi:hypothetical protein